jgi:putative sterol carrier protein
MHLPLFEEAIAAECHTLREARTVLADRVVLILQVKTEVQSVVGGDAHSAGTRCKRMTEAVPIQKGGMQSTHIVLCSTARLREPPLHAKEAVPQVRAGSWLVHRFPSEEWNDRTYREVGKAWTFGAVAMVVRSDPANGVKQATGIILDVHAGECRSARLVEGTDDPPDAEFVIVASYARWKEVIERKLDPIKGMMDGKLKLTRGHLPTIIRYVEPARLLVSSASKVPTDFD